MGSDLRFDYSVLGDSVNLASRLEGQSKEYGFPIIVGSKTALAAKDKFAILELDFIMVKGKKEPEVIYAIAGREDTAHSGRFQRLRNLTIEMLACYRSRDWDGAVAAIERGRRTDEGGALELLYNLYEARIQGYQKEPAAGRLERSLRLDDEVARAATSSRRYALDRSIVVQGRRRLFSVRRDNSVISIVFGSALVLSSSAAASLNSIKLRAFGGGIAGPLGSIGASSVGAQVLAGGAIIVLGIWR